MSRADIKNSFERPHTRAVLDLHQLYSLDCFTEGTRLLSWWQTVNLESRFWQLGFIMQHFLIAFNNSCSHTSLTLCRLQPSCFTHFIYSHCKVYVSLLLSLVSSSPSEQSSEEEVKKRKVSIPPPRNVSESESDDDDSPSDSSQDSESEDSESEAEVKKKKKVRGWRIMRSLIHISDRPIYRPIIDNIICRYLRFLRRFLRFSGMIYRQFNKLSFLNWDF